MIVVPGRAGWWGAGILAACTTLAVLWAQPAPPPAPPRPPIPAQRTVGEQIADITKKLSSAKAVNQTATRALEYSSLYLKAAEKAIHSGRYFAADRLVDAADALARVADHQQHLRQGGDLTRPLSADEVQRHLERVYFRTQQADYFFEQARDPKAASLPQWARDFRQLAVKAFDRRDLVAADENAKCADDVVKALEDLAQAAAPPPEHPILPPPPPGPPR